MPWVATNNVDTPFAFNDLTVLADSLDARSNFHSRTTRERGKATEYIESGNHRTRALNAFAANFGGSAKNRPQTKTFRTESELASLLSPGIHAGSNPGKHLIFSADSVDLLQQVAIAIIVQHRSRLVCKNGKSRGHRILFIIRSPSA